MPVRTQRHEESYRMFLPEGHFGFTHQEAFGICLRVAYKNMETSLCVPDDLNVRRQALTPRQQINVTLLMMLRPNEDAGTLVLLLYH